MAYFVLNLYSTNYPPTRVWTKNFHKKYKQDIIKCAVQVGLTDWTCRVPPTSLLFYNCGIAAKIWQSALLFQIHYFVEPFCVCLKRTLPPLHPLHQMLKYHCREVIVPNTFGTPALTNQLGFMSKLFGYGEAGAKRLIRAGRPLSTWQVTDFRGNIKVQYLSRTKTFNLVRPHLNQAISDFLRSKKIKVLLPFESVFA